MNTHDPSFSPLAVEASIPEEGSPKTRHFAPSWRLLTLAAEVAALLLVALALGFLLSSCSDSQNASQDVPVQVAVAETPPSGSVEARRASVAREVRPPETTAMPSVEPPDSLPPDVMASASQTEVEPGDVVEITARATGDVVEVALWDGIHDKQPMVFDPNAKLWRAQYRVPLGTVERVGLSVTAKNPDHRWHRVWVFLSTPHASPAERDTTSD